MPIVNTFLRRLRHARRPVRRFLDRTDWGDLRGLQPRSRHYGVERGAAIDRFYIEQFLAGHAGDVRGTVLEVASDAYTRRFGGTKVDKAEVVSIVEGPGVTIVGDLTEESTLPPAHFDCIVLTQTLCFIYEASKALATCHAALKPGGVLLMTVPGICQISSFDHDLTGDYWRFTTASTARLLDETFPGGAVTVRSYGNVLAATAFLQGLAQEELSAEELAHDDGQYQMIVAARAVKAK